MYLSGPVGAGVCAAERDDSEAGVTPFGFKAVWATGGAAGTALGGGAGGGTWFWATGGGCFATRGWAGGAGAGWSDPVPNKPAPGNDGFVVGPFG